MNQGNKAIASEAVRNKAVLAEAYAAYRWKDPGPLLSLLAEDACYNSVAGRPAVEDLSRRAPEGLALSRVQLQVDRGRRASGHSCRSSD